MDSQLKAEKLERMAELLKCIAHPLRLEIIDLLEKYQRLCVGDLVERMNVEQSVVSHHLTKLKDKGVLKSTREGKNVYYQIAMIDLMSVFNCIEHCAV